MHKGETFSETFYDINTFILWIFWGIAIIVQVLHVFGFDLISCKIGRNVK